MVDVVAEAGYARASVARVIEAAGVSRATFYEHFDNREDCFLASYRTVSARLRNAVRLAAGEADHHEKPEAVLGALLDGLAAAPAEAQVVLLEALAAPLDIRVEHERLIRRVEELVEGYLATADSQFKIPPAALVGAIGRMTSIRVLRNETASLSSLRNDLIAWLKRYGEKSSSLPLSAITRRWRDAPPLVSGRDHDPPPLLPRGRSALPPPDAALARRRRLLEATVRVTAQRGYAKATVGAITSEARVPRNAFYSHFSSKEEAFLAAQTMSLQESVAAAAAEFFLEPEWPERVWQGLWALLTFIAEHSDLAFLGAETYIAGEAAVELEHQNLMAYTLFLEDGHRLAGQHPPPPITSEAVAGAIHGLIRREMLSGRTRRLPEILPQCAYVALAPFVGPSESLAFVDSRLRAAC